MKNKHLGSSFDSLLEEGLCSEIKVTAIKHILAYELQKWMKKNNISKSEMVHKMKTSRSSLNRLLNSENTSITLLTLTRVATIIGKKLDIYLY